MDAEEVSKRYLAQAQKLQDFLKKIDEKDYNKEELKAFIKIIAQSYFELLINLSYYTPILSQTSIVYFQTKSLPDNKLNEPPFEKEFFNRIES